MSDVISASSELPSSTGEEHRRLMIQTEHVSGCLGRQRELPPQWRFKEVVLVRLPIFGRVPAVGGDDRVADLFGLADAVQEAPGSVVVLGLDVLHALTLRGRSIDSPRREPGGLGR